MIALITGASAGLGRDMARILSKMGYDLILVARRENRMLELKQELDTNVDVICKDLSKAEECFSLYEQVKDRNIDIVINNAGFGIFGETAYTDIDKELNMLDLNVRAVLILTKLFLKDFKERDEGYILNVASIAAFMSGPLMNCYYATKGFVLKYTEAINEELRQCGSRVYVGALCPGPTQTEFLDKAEVKFKIGSSTSEYVANYGIKKMFSRKMVILPRMSIKLSRFGLRFLPDRIMVKIAHSMQMHKDVK